MKDQTAPVVNPSAIFMLATSLTVAALTIIASMAGIISPARFYPSEALRQFALANDVTNLIIGVPILLGSIWLDRRGKYIGQLLWPGALMYTLYNYLAYVVALPISWLYIAYLLIVALGIYSLVPAVANIDFDTAQARLKGRVPDHFAGAVLLLLGGFVFIRVFGVITSAELSAATVEITERSLLLADALLAPAWIIGGVMLWMRKPLGYATGLALLFQGSMLFIGLIVVFLLQPLVISAAIPWLDIVVVSLMGLICFVPLVLYWRGISRS